MDLPKKKKKQINPDVFQSRTLSIARNLRLTVGISAYDRTVNYLSIRQVYLYQSVSLSAVTDILYNFYRYALVL